MKKRVNRSRKNNKLKLQKIRREKINITEIGFETKGFVKTVIGAFTFEGGIVKEKVTLPRSIDATRMFLLN